MRINRIELSSGKCLNENSFPVQEGKVAIKLNNMNEEFFK